MRDSSVYQAILAEGRVEGQIQGELAALRGTLRRQGTRRFGLPRPEDEAALSTIADIPRLERMTDRVLSAADWADLLSTP